MAIDYILAASISHTFRIGKYRKKLAGGVGTALFVHQNKRCTAYRIIKETCCIRYPRNTNAPIRREATNYKLIQPIRGTSPELWELTELGNAICNDIMNEYNRRMNEAEKMVTGRKKINPLTFFNKVL